MRPSRRSVVWIAGAAMSVLALGVGVGYAQIWRGGYGFSPARFATKNSFKGEFNFCRLAFASTRREKRGWDTDYPGADINFSIRLGEITKTRVSMTDGAEGSDPDYVVVRATDDAVFECPFILIEDGGGAHFSDDEVYGLRRYLLKGGFILAADYWGPLARAQFDAEIGRVLPPSEFPIKDIPADHPVWRTQFEVPKVPQMASIQYWRRSGGGISERGAESATVDVRGIADEHGNLMVLMLHNTDIPDGWEREAEDPEYFYKFSPDAYAVGIDVALYAMTH